MQPETRAGQCVGVTFSMKMIESYKYSTVSCKLFARPCAILYTEKQICGTENIK